MTQPGPRFERFLEQAARAVSGTGHHPIAILQRVQAAAENGLRDSAVPNRYRVEYSGADGSRVARIERLLISGIEQMLDEMVEERHLSRLASWDVNLLATPALAPGEIRVHASFSQPAHRGLAPSELLDRRTQVITRVQGTVLVLGDGTRVRVQHTPFVIGRANGCDLVVPDLSVSRRHAVIRSEAAGPLVLHDLESRNGIVVSGERVAELPLIPGAMFALGEASFTVEADT